MSEASAAAARPRGMRAFLLIWFGQVVSNLGSGLSSFALGVWVFKTTRSATAYSLIILFAFLPSTLLSPIAGALTDRWGQRKVMLLSNYGAGACTLAMALLYWGGQLAIWHVYVIVFASRCFSVFQYPAFSAATALLVPRRQLVRANGMAQLGPAAAQIAAPLLAAVLMEVIGLGGVILVDASSFLFAAATLIAIAIPRPAVSAAGREGSGTLLHESIYGWTYIRQRPGLLALLLFFAFANFCLTVVQILITPLVLSFSSAKTLGAVLTLGAAGAVLGGIALGLWGGGSLRRIQVIMAFTVLEGATLLLGGLRPSVVLVAAATSIALFAMPIIRGSSEALWQVKVPQDLQGRVFAIRRMIAGVAFPLAAAAAGPLSDRVFEPLLVPGGLLAGSVGLVLGVGGGGGWGTGLLFMMLGVLTILSVAVARAYRPLREVETSLPDALLEPMADPAPAVLSDAAANAAAPTAPRAAPDLVLPGQPGLAPETRG
jgi:DHA3 family macrolide efflux protein-like MFS transporter